MSPPYDIRWRRAPPMLSTLATFALVLGVLCWSPTVEFLRRLRVRWSMLGMLRSVVINLHLALPTFAFPCFSHVLGALRLAALPNRPAHEVKLLEISLLRHRHARRSPRRAICDDRARLNCRERRRLSRFSWKWCYWLFSGRRSDITCRCWERSERVFSRRSLRCA